MAIPVEGLVSSITFGGWVRVSDSNSSEALFRAVASTLLRNGKSVPIPKTGLLIKLARPAKWINRKRDWYRGETGIVQGQSPLSYTTLMPPPVEAVAAIGRALSNHK